MTSTPSDDGIGIGPLRTALAERADTAGLLDIAYRTLDTPVGTLLLAATPRGLVRVAYPREDLDRVLATLATKLSPRVLEAPRRLDPAVRQLDEYFARRRRRLDLPVDLSLAAGFRRRVLGYLPAIGYGHTASYAAVASAVDNPRAARAVGTACATNPLPLVIPCHRVIRSGGAVNGSVNGSAGGSVGGYVGGPDAKRRLLDLEELEEEAV